MKFLDLEAQIDSDDEFSEDENRDDDNGFIDHGTCQTPLCLIC
jgi:hypothetical protein